MDKINRRSLGAVAQLGEHLPCTQGVRSSSLLGSTKTRGTGLASEPESKRVARTMCLDFGFFAGLNKIHLDEAKRLSLERLVRRAAARRFEVCRLSRDAYQLEVEKCVCAAASPSRCGRATRVVATTGKIRRTFTNRVAKCSRASSPPSLLCFAAVKGGWLEQRGFGCMVK